MPRTSPCAAKTPVTAEKNKTPFMASKYNFHSLNNVVMTPHISAWSKNMIIRRSKIIKKNIENLFNGKKLLNQIEINQLKCELQ